MADLDDTMIMTSMTRIGAEPASPKQVVGDSGQDEAGLPNADGKHGRDGRNAQGRGKGEEGSGSVDATKEVVLNGTGGEQ